MDLDEADRLYRAWQAALVVKRLARDVLTQAADEEERALIAWERVATGP